MKQSDDEDDKKAYQAIQQEQPKIKFNASGETEFDLNAEEFWRLFAGPSFQAFLHYSVNTYTNDPVDIESPLAEAIELEKS